MVHLYSSFHCPQIVNVGYWFSLFNKSGERSRKHPNNALLLAGCGSGCVPIFWLVTGPFYCADSDNFLLDLYVTGYSGSFLLGGCCNPGDCPQASSRASPWCQWSGSGESTFLCSELTLLLSCSLYVRQQPLTGWQRLREARPALPLAQIPSSPIHSPYSEEEGGGEGFQVLELVMILLEVISGWILEQATAGGSPLV